MSPDIENFVRKATRSIEQRIIDAKARVKNKKLSDPRRAFFEGRVQGLTDAIVFLRGAAKEWEP